MSAKNAELQRTGSHHVKDDHGAIDGISKEQVFGYFTATWRGQPVQVTMQSDRYAHSSGLSDWRTYASEARFLDTEKNGGRGEYVTDTARAALSKLCEPLMTEWLTTDAYTASFQAAAAHMIMRKFRDERYFGSSTRSVTSALAIFQSRLTKELYQAISETLAAYGAYSDAADRADAIISSITS